MLAGAAALTVAKTAKVHVPLNTIASPDLFARVLAAAFAGAVKEEAGAETADPE